MNRPNKEKLFTVRVTQEEMDMIKTLKSPPYKLNMSKCIRTAIIYLYKKKTSEAKNAE